MIHLWNKPKFNIAQLSAGTSVSVSARASANASASVLAGAGAGPRMELYYNCKVNFITNLFSNFSSYSVSEMAL